MVSGLVHGVGIARDFPAPEVLGADGDAQRGWRIWTSLLEVVGHFLAVVELIGLVLAVDLDDVGVFRVRLIDQF